VDKNSGGVPDENVIISTGFECILTDHYRSVHFMLVLIALLKGQLEAGFGRIGVKLKFVHL
jgi:hypothetical protein